MPLWSKFRKKRLLEPEDFDALRPTVVIIDSIDTEEGKDLKTGEVFERHLLRFVGWKLPMRISTTHVKAIEALYGKNTEDCIGRPIALVRDTYEAYGQTKPCIKILPQAPNAEMASLPAREYLDERPHVMSRAAELGMRMHAPTAAQLAAPSRRAAQARDDRPIGEENAQRFLAKARTLGGSYEGFLRRLKRLSVSDHDTIVGRDIPDLPRWLVPEMTAYLEDLEEMRRIAQAEAKAEQGGAGVDDHAPKPVNRDLPPSERAAAVAESVGGVRRGFSPSDAARAASSVDEIGDPDIQF